MTVKSLPEVPAALADVALIDGPACAASCGVSLSKWLELVREGDAPPPVVRQARYTRWSVGTVRAWSVGRANESDPQAAKRLIDRATRASQKARLARSISVRRA